MRIATHQFQGRRQVGQVSADGSTVRGCAIDDHSRGALPLVERVAADPAVVQTIGRAGSPIEYLDAPEFQVCRDATARVKSEAVRRIGKVQ